MSTYTLDPRMAGKAAPDVRTRFIGGAWDALKHPDPSGKGPCYGPFSTEAAALAAARAAAGFAHVAEKPCESWTTDDCDNPDHDNPAVPFCDCRSQDPACSRCAWPRDAHGAMEHASA